MNPNFEYDFEQKAKKIAIYEYVLYGGILIVTLAVYLPIILKLEFKDFHTTMVALLTTCYLLAMI